MAASTSPPPASPREGSTQTPTRRRWNLLRRLVTSKSPTTNGKTTIDDNSIGGSSCSNHTKKNNPPPPVNVVIRNVNVMRRFRSVFRNGSDEEICKYVDRYPEHCQCQFVFYGGTGGEKVYPLMVLCKRKRLISVRTLQVVYDAYPNAIEGTIHAYLLGCSTSNAKASLSIVKFLISKHPDGCEALVPLQKGGHDRYSYLPLHVACTNHRISSRVIKYLIQQYPLALQETVGGKSYKLPLHMAIQNNLPIDIIKLLVSKYPQALQEADYETTQITRDPNNGWIRYHGKFTLLDLNSNTSKTGGLPLHLACRQLYPNVELIQYLLSEFPDAIRCKNHAGWLPLHFACYHGDFHFGGSTNTGTAAGSHNRFGFIRSGRSRVRINSRARSVTQTKEVIRLLVALCPDALLEKATFLGHYPVSMLCFAAGAGRSRGDKNNNYYDIIQYMIAQHPIQEGRPDHNIFLSYLQEATRASEHSYGSTTSSVERIRYFLDCVIQQSSRGYFFVYTKEDSNNNISKSSDNRRKNRLQYY